MHGPTTRKIAHQTPLIIDSKKFDIAIRYPIEEYRVRAVHIISYPFLANSIPCKVKRRFYLRTEAIAIVCLSVCPSVCHTGGSVKSGAS